jgi:hypothetical protein
MSTRVLVTITEQAIDRHREALCAWATANGIDPRRIASRPGLTIERSGRRGLSIVYRELQRDVDGRWLPDPDRPDEVWTVRKATPMTRPLAEFGLTASDLDGHPGS